MVGFNVPFKSEKSTRVPKEDQLKCTHLIDPKTNEEIKRIVNCKYYPLKVNIYSKKRRKENNTKRNGDVREVEIPRGKEKTPKDL